MPAEARFRAMGSDCHIILVGGSDNALQLARAEISRLERLWSRFIDASEISVLNASAGHPAAVGEETFELVRVAVEAWRVTSGLFDPTVLRALETAGYDRSFEQLDPLPTARVPVAPAPPSPGCADIVMDHDAMTIELPSGVSFDPGGIGKGYAADRVSHLLLEHGGVRGACVNLGGDLRVWGEPPSSDAWAIGIDDPTNDETIATIALEEGAVATSSRARRRWALAGQTMHHIIDPRTGAPATSDLIAVSVVAGETWWAEVMAKVALITGVDAGARFLKDLDVPSLLVESGGEIHALCGMETSLS